MLLTQQRKDLTKHYQGRSRAPARSRPAVISAATVSAIVLQSAIGGSSERRRYCTESKEVIAPACKARLASRSTHRTRWADARKGPM